MLSSSAQLGAAAGQRALGCLGERRRRQRRQQRTDRTTSIRGSVLVLVCMAQFMVVLDATVVNVALPSIQQGPGHLRRRPAVDRHRLRADLRRVPAPRRARRRPARAQARVPRRPRRLQHRVAPERPRTVLGVPDHLPRAAGARRGADLTGRPVDHHDHVRGGRRPGPRAERLGGDRGRRRRGRAAARRHPHRPPFLAVDLLHQRPGRHRRLRRHPALGAGVQGSGAHKSRPAPAPSPSTAGLLLLVYTIVKAQEKGWGSLHTIGFAALSFALLAAFLLIERRSRSRSCR